MLLVALVLAGGLPHRVVAKRPAPDPAALCAARKLAASGGAAMADLRCHSKAAAKGGAADAACLAGPRQRLAGAFGKAEGRGGCAVTGDAGAVADGLEQRARDLADLLRPLDVRSKCAAKQLKALGGAAKTLYHARAKFAVDADQGKLDRVRAAARKRVERAFAKAARKGGCVTLAEVPTTPDQLAERAGGTSGALQVRLEAVKRIRIALAARPEILAKRAAIEAAGFGVADDGSVLTGTPVPAAGWLVTLGTGRGRSNEAGIATLDVPIDAPAEGQIFHGASDTFVVGPVFRSELRPAGESLQTITFEIANDGPCGMNENPADDSAQCHAAAAAANRVSVPRPADPVADESQLNPDPMLFPPKITTEFGTYPNPDVAAEQIACLDYDGLIESHTDRGDSSEAGIIAYPGSTCNIQVNLGCCDNEAADIRRQIASAVSERFPVMACVANHKGRFCQSVTKGDVAIEVKGDIIKAGQTKEYEVSEGERVPILVHNNGCYGDTRVNEGFLASVLPLGGRIVDGTLGRLTGGVIHHQADSGDYFVDRDVAYQAPSPCPSDFLARFRRDRYEFETDGSAARVAFRCPPSTTTTTLVCPGGIHGRFTQQGCQGIVEYHGTSHFVHDEVTEFTSDHEEASAQFVLTNDPATGVSRDTNTFVVKSGSVTYSASYTSGGCTTTVSPTTHPLEPYPGTIPGAMLIGEINNGVRFVAATLIQLVPVTEHEVCPPPTGTTDRQDTQAVGYLLIPGPPVYSVSPDAEIITGSFTDEANKDTWEWSLHRVEASSR